MCQPSTSSNLPPRASRSKRVLNAVKQQTKVQGNTDQKGINEDYISELVDEFYSRIRADSELGPIFAAGISDWQTHLPTMKRFWSSVALNTGKYSGRPVPAHINIKHMVDPQHFVLWLAIFQQTLNDTAPNAEVAEYFMVRATRIAKSLQLAMFGDPNIPAQSSNINKENRNE